MNREERILISSIVCDLLTGNHLLGRPRSEEQISEKELFKEAASNFYGGAEDMCEQLGIDKKVLKLIE